MPETIHFFVEKTPFAIPGKRILRRWLENAIREENGVPGAINFIICNDDYLLKMNKKYLKQKTLTDILTFPMADDDKTISADMYISIERIRDNSKKFKVQVKKELARVMIHGILHLLGYDDHDEEGMKKMREKEDYYLAGLVLW
ncbi:MAG TPA: rRNA maturation RNase YbeY [Bacteroidales bacterium]|nr:rRNA maturation RNase YbeY [Bacteroidales bacterium]HPS72944.1 rRNA maturation RNase YbeY [Bacteroidales bacterium]